MGKNTCELWISSYIRSAQRWCFMKYFFPESSTAMALILAMGTYGAGYVARIVGAFIFRQNGRQNRA